MPRSIRQKTTLKQTQGLTPQLAQSLKILQLNQQELELEISRMLDENIMLERHDEEFSFIDDKKNSIEDPTNLDEPLLYEQLPNELDIDANWEDIYEDYNHKTPSYYQNKSIFEPERVATEVSFDAKIENSIDFTQHLCDDERVIAKKILEYLDNDYFLITPIEELSLLLDVSEKELEHIIYTIRHLEPPGVASKNTQECLLAQLNNIDNQNQHILNAKKILKKYFIYIDKKPKLIQQRLGISEIEFQKSLQIIKELSPYPRAEENSHIRYIYPDIYVHQHLGMFYASLNKDIRYDIGINEAYLSATKDCKGDEQVFIKAQLRIAKFFLQALDYRNETILRIANAIVIHQQAYFHRGEKVIKPLKMKDLANLLSLSESTISRAVNGKYLSFNKQLIELRNFFSTDLSMTSSTSKIEGHEQGELSPVSSTAAKAWISEFIQQEDPKLPLSDRQIEEHLKIKEIYISRRTITKYRESLGIEKSSKRKSKN